MIKFEECPKCHGSVFTTIDGNPGCPHCEMYMWTNKFPTEEGSYWFYGWLSKYDKKNSDRKLRSADVHKISNGFMYVSEGSFMYEAEGAESYWLYIPKPSLPLRPIHYWNGKKVKILKESGLAKEDFEVVVDSYDEEKNQVSFYKLDKAWLVQTVDTKFVRTA